MSNASEGTTEMEDLSDPISAALDRKQSISVKALRFFNNAIQIRIHR